MRTGNKIIHLLAFSSGGTAFAEAGPVTSGQKDRGLRVRMAPAVLGIASSAADTGTRQDHGRWAPAGGPIDRVWPQPARLRTQGWPCTKASLPVGRWRWASGNPERRPGPRNGASVAGTVHPGAGRLTDNPTGPPISCGPPSRRPSARLRSGSGSPLLFGSRRDPKTPNGSFIFASWRLERSGREILLTFFRQRQGISPR